MGAAAGGAGAGTQAAKIAPVAAADSCRKRLRLSVCKRLMVRPSFHRPIPTKGDPVTYLIGGICGILTAAR
ncbi:MAG: hypothetical protein Kow0047_31580 [Anaerolineae bacterium]